MLLEKEGSVATITHIFTFEWKITWIRMDVLMCFQADVLLEILRVRVSG